MKVLPDVQREPPCFSVWSLPLDLSWAAVKRAWLHPLYIFLQVFVYSDDIHHAISLLQPEQPQLSHSLSSQYRCSSPFTILMALHWTVSVGSCLSCKEDSRMWHNTPGVTSPVQNRGAGSLSCSPFSICKRTLLVHVELGVLQDHHVIFCQASLQLSCWLTLTVVYPKS